MQIPKIIQVPITRASASTWPDDLETFVEVDTTLWGETHAISDFAFKALCHGLKQLVNDSVADPKKYPTANDVFDRCSTKADELSTMDHTFGGGGGERLSVEEKVLREAIVTDARKRFAMKAVDANKIAMTPQEYFRKVAAKEASTPDAVEAAFQELIAPIVAAKKAATGLTLKL